MRASSITRPLEMMIITSDEDRQYTTRHQSLNANWCMLCFYNKVNMMHFFGFQCPILDCYVVDVLDVLGQQL